LTQIELDGHCSIAAAKPCFDWTSQGPAAIRESCTEQRSVNASDPIPFALEQRPSKSRQAHAKPSKIAQASPSRLTCHHNSIRRTSRRTIMSKVIKALAIAMI
jgi:hypothetical protein